MTGHADLDAQIKELQRIVALLIARTGNDQVELTAAEMMDVPPYAQIVVWHNPMNLGVTVALRGMPPIDGIVDAEWVEEPGPKAIGA